MHFYVSLSFQLVCLKAKVKCRDGVLLLYFHFKNIFIFTPLNLNFGQKWESTFHVGWIVGFTQNRSSIEQLMRVILAEKLLKAGVSYSHFGRIWTEAEI